VLENYETFSIVLEKGWIFGGQQVVLLMKEDFWLMSSKVQELHAVTSVNIRS
jgi:hypothetical protein